MSLGPAQYELLSGASIGGLVRFPAAGEAGAQYLVVAQFATGVNDVQNTVNLTAGAAPVARLVAGSPEYSLAQLGASPAQRFHEALRVREREITRSPPAASQGVQRAPQAPPVPGSKRDFKVCGNLQCSTLVTVQATALYVGAHAAIFVDDTLPSGGFTQADLDQMGAEFDTTLYPIDVAAFGNESDIDGNGVVIILLTDQVNKLVPAPDCENAFVTGYFFGADLALTGYNGGEVFYGFVPDPTGAAACDYSAAMVRALLPVTFAHEFQHMISFNHHYLVRGGGAEVMWLNEAMSHLAEELVGLHYDSLGETTRARPFLRGNFYNAFQYLKDPSVNAMVSDSPPGTLAARGGEWLFLRYLADQYGMSAIRAMSNTGLTGAANVAAATATPFATLVGRWALAVYASDLAAFTAPAELRYTTYSLRDEFAALNAESPQIFTSPFPLVPANGSPHASLSGTVASGSGMYVVLTQPANGASFDITFRGANGGSLPSSASAQLAIVRIR